MAKGIWIYVQVVLCLISILTGIVVLQAAINAHNTLAILAAVLGLLGLPPLVAFFVKQISK